MTTKDLQTKSIEYRKKILQYIVSANAGRTGGSLSCIDLLNVLYNHVLNVSPQNFSSPDRVRYIQSKGHCVEALFVVLADQGFFPEEDLQTLCKYRSHYIGHPTRKIKGVEQNTGALGHGLPIAVGTAIAAKLDEKDFKVFTLLGDGELPGRDQIGKQRLLRRITNWITSVPSSTDSLQITGPTTQVCNTDPLDDKFESFGWSVRSVDGHDLDALVDIFDALPFEPGKPSLIIANTVKGKGVSFMENNLKWHHGVPNKSEYETALSELNNALSLQIQ